MPASVAHVTTWSVPCGIAKHLSYWLPHLPPSRACRIAAEIPPPWYEAHPAGDGWPALPSKRCWHRGRPDVFASLAADFADCRILHFQWDPSFYPAKEFEAFADDARRRGVSTVVTAHTLELDEVWTLANKAMLRAADRIVVGTPAMAQACRDYAARFNIRLRRPVEEIPLPCPPVPSHVSGPKASVNGSPLIVSWGLLGKLKGHEEVIHAVEKLRSRRWSKARCIVQGVALTGEQKKNLEALHALRLGDWFEVREQWASEAELYALCRMADAVVLNHCWAHASSSGTVALSVASGASVVVSNSPMFSGYEGAVIVAGGAHNGMVDALVQAFDPPPWLVEGRRKRLLEIAPAAVAARYEAIYAELETAPIAEVLYGTPKPEPAPAPAPAAAPPLSLPVPDRPCVLAPPAAAAPPPLNPRVARALQVALNALKADARAALDKDRFPEAADCLAAAAELARMIAERKPL